MHVNEYNWFAPHVLCFQIAEKIALRFSCADTHPDTQLRIIVFSNLINQLEYFA